MSKRALLIPLAVIVLYWRPSWLASDELFTIATWIDTGAGFVFLPDGEQDGGPGAVGVLPCPGSIDVPQNTRIAVHFNAPIDRATVDGDTFELWRVIGSAMAGTWRWGTNRDVLFRPDAPLATGEAALSNPGSRTVRCGGEPRRSVGVRQWPRWHHRDRCGSVGTLIRISS